MRWFQGFHFLCGGVPPPANFRDASPQFPAVSPQFPAVPRSFPAVPRSSPQFARNFPAPFSSEHEIEDKNNEFHLNSLNSLEHMKKDAESFLLCNFTRRTLVFRKTGKVGERRSSAHTSPQKQQSIGWGGLLAACCTETWSDSETLPSASPQHASALLQATAI